MSDIEIEQDELATNLCEMKESLVQTQYPFYVYAMDAYEAVSRHDYERAERHLNGLFLVQAPYTEQILDCLHRVKRLSGVY